MSDFGDADPKSPSSENKYDIGSVIRAEKHGALIGSFCMEESISEMPNVTSIFAHRLGKVDTAVCI